MTADFYTLAPEAQGQVMEKFARIAIRAWDREAESFRLVKMRENVVFDTRTTEGEQFALRIHRYNYHSDDNLRSEILWTSALSAAGIDVPQLIPTAAGSPFAVVESGHLPEPRQVDMYAWIEGQQLGSVESGLENEGSMQQIFHTLGEEAARIHNQSAAWQLPDGFSRHAWDADGLTGEQPFWGRFWELQALTAAQRDLILKARAEVHKALLEYGKPEHTYSMIHADLTAENILINGDKFMVIDFDDAGFGWHQFEIVTALLFFMGEPFFDKAEESMIKGYRSRRDLHDRDLELLPVFYLARAFTYLGWVHTRYETDTARELTPGIVELACSLADDFLSGTT